jgi:hypothetical protein
MANISKYSHPLIIQSLLFLIPINIYVIGDWLSAGVQWIFFRYQQSSLGDSLIFFIRDIDYIQRGILKGKSVLAVEVAILATVFMVLAFLILIFTYGRESIVLIKAAALTSVSGGVLYLVSDIIQYGIFFQGPAGFVIPIGVPVIFLAGWWMYRMGFPDDDTDASDV